MAGSGNERDRIEDYVSGRPVRPTPEETEAVQPFSRKLVKDYGYPKENIRTRPQFRVGVSPSDRRGYPVDIAVFSSKTHDDGALQIIVECKSKTRKDGRRQLESYLKFCGAQLGVWYNGEEQLVLRKLVRGGGESNSENFRTYPSLARGSKTWASTSDEISRNRAAWLQNSP